jgi:hypothetical protein
MRVVITAAHCLPRLPIAAPFSQDSEGGLYQRLLGPLGSEPTVWGECFFADPVADIAVIGTPDTQTFGNEADRFEALVEDAVPLSLSDFPAEEEITAWMFSVEGKWFQCTAQHFGGPLVTKHEAELIQGGMSGSPILASDASVIGAISMTSENSPHDGGPHPRPICDLPQRFFRLSPKPSQR